MSEELIQWVATRVSFPLFSGSVFTFAPKFDWDFSLQIGGARSEDDDVLEDDYEPVYCPQYETTSWREDGSLVFSGK